MTKKVIEFSPPESSRVYNFPGVDKICLYDVVKVTIGESGTHYVEYIDSYTHEINHLIVTTGWLSLEVSGEQNWPGENRCMCDSECGNNCKCNPDSPHFDHWTDDEKLQLAIAADEIICIANNLWDNPALQKFFAWMEEHDFS